MAAISETSSEAIIPFNQVANFDQLPIDEATKIIYDQLVPACEAEGIFLSVSGNKYYTAEVYDNKKAEHQLFNVERIQKAFASLDDVFQITSQYFEYSDRSWLNFWNNFSGVKHDFEKYQNLYIARGDFIAAMLIKGYTAKFKKDSSPSDGAVFNLKPVDDLSNVKRVIAANNEKTTELLQSYFDMGLFK